MIMIFEKVTPGRHEGPEDVGLLMGGFHDERGAAAGDPEGEARHAN